jgi:thioredoxin reductase
MLKFYPFLKDAGWGDAENLRRKSKGGKTVMTYGAGNATSQAILGAVEPDDGAKKVFAVSRKPFKTETSNNQVDRLDDWVNEGKVEYVSGSILGAEQLPNGKWIARVGTEKRMPDGSKKVLNEKTFEVDHIENFLGSTYNTDWLPNEIEVTPFTRVVTDPKTGHKTEVQIPLPQKPGLIKMLNGAKQTTMEGVYAGGDARAGTDFMEEPPRRIDRATGDAAGIAASIHSDLQHLEKYGKLPEWNPRSKEVKEADQRLKDLLDSGEPQSPTVGRRPSGPETTGSQATKKLPATPSAMPSRSTSEPSTSPKTRAELLQAQEDAHARFTPLRDRPLDDPERVAAWSVFKAARDAFNKSKPPPPRFDPSVAHKARGLIESAERTQKEVIAAEEKAAKARKIRFGEAGTTLFQPTSQQQQQQDFPTPKGRVRLAPGEAAPPAEYPPGKIARFNKYDDAQLQAELRQRTNLKPYTDAEIGGELSRRQALTQGRQETPPVQIQPKGDFLDNPYQNFVEQGFQQRAEARAQERPPSEPGMIAEPEIPEFPSRPPNLRERLRDSPQTLSTPDLVDAIGEGQRLRDTFGRPETREEKQLQTDLTGKIDSLQKIVDAREKHMMEDPARVEAEARRRVTDNPTYPDKLVSDLATGKKASIDAADEKILLNQRAAFTHGRDAQGNRAMDKTLDPGERASAASQYEDLNKKIDLMDEATDNGNRIKGAPARNLWHQFRQRDYELPSMERKLSIAKGGVPLTKAETADLKVKTDRLAKAMTDVQAAKVKTGWTPGLGANVAPGLRHKQYVEHQAKEALDDTIFKETMKNRGLLNKSLSTTGQVVDLSRAVMTSMDLSAIRRQGGLFFMGSPARSARIMKDMLRAAKSDEGYFKLMQDIRERPNAQLYIDSKLGLTDIRSPKLSALEEMYMSRWADKIPLVNNSQRAYVYFLNRLRADVFDTMAGNLGQKGHVTAAQAKQLSNFINVFSGRGTLEGDAANAAALLNRAFFAPRYVISRFQALTLQPLRYAHDPKVRMLIAKEYAKTLIGYAVTYGLVAAALPMLGASVEYDPRSSDFGKIKIGNTRIDILSGLGQATVLLARLITGHTKTPSGKIQKLYGKHPVSQRDVDNVILDMFRSKLAPIPAATWNAAKGKKVTGEETNIGWEALGLVTPLSGKDIYTALLEQGVVKGTALGLIAFFGDSVNTYATKGRVRQRKAHRTR